MKTAHLIADGGACVRECGEGSIDGKKGKCVQCEGPCPKRKLTVVKGMSQTYINMP